MAAQSARKGIEHTFTQQSCRITYIERASHNVLLVLAQSPKCSRHTIMSSMSKPTAAAKSTSQCRPNLRKLRFWRRHSSPIEAPGEGPYIERRMNRSEDLQNGQFADALLRLMHQRGHLEDPYHETSVLSAQGGRPCIEQDQVRKGKSAEQAKKHKREFDLRPGGEPIGITLYHLVSQLVKDKCSSKSKDRRHHHSSNSQAARLTNGNRSSS